MCLAYQTGRDVTEGHMKKLGKKLVIHRETVRVLDQSGLQGAAGGLDWRGVLKSRGHFTCSDDTLHVNCTAGCPNTMNVPGQPPCIGFEL